MALLDPQATYALLCDAGISLARQSFVHSSAGLQEAAAKVGYPVALKAFVPGQLHRTAAGAVRLGIKSPAELARAAQELELVDGIAGYVVQAMETGDVEMMLGLRRDPVFGPAITVAAGGALVESIADSSIRLVPVTEAEARSMLSELRMGSSRYRELVAGFATWIVGLSRLAENHPEISELDLNPVLVSNGRGIAVDAKVLVEMPAAEPPGTRVRRNLAPLLEPASIAVIGASANPSKQGGRLMRYLIAHRFPGAIYPVNPREEEILGRRCYRQVDDLPEAADLACIAVRADLVAGVLDACGRRGIRAAVVFTSGFGETGADGRSLQDAIVAAAGRHGMLLMGPNTAGVMDASRGLCAAIGMAFEIPRIPGGEVALISQSGAIGGALLSRAWEQGIGVGRWICTGNEADLTLGEYMEWIIEDPSTRVLALFVETLRDVSAFRDACARARKLGKPVLVYKTGASVAGKRAMQTHTGAIAGDDAVSDAALRSFGAIRVPDLQSLLDGAAVISRSPAAQGRRIAVASASGGACSVVADECEKRGLSLSELTDSTVDSIRGVIPTFGVPTNPVDVTMEVTVRPSMLGEVASLLLEDPGVDALLVMLTTNADPPAVTVAQGVIAAARASSKPVVIARMGAEFLAPASLALYREAGIPVFPMPERAVAALSALAAAADVGHGGADGLSA